MSKLKSFCTAKTAINKTKRQPTEQEKIIANHVSDKRLISKIYKESTQLITNRNLIKKWEEGPSRYFSSRKAYRWSTDTWKELNITNHQGNENQNHTCQIPSSKRTQITSIGEDVGKKGILVHCLWENKLMQPFWKIAWRVLRKMKTAILSRNSTPVYLSKEN